MSDQDKTSDKAPEEDPPEPRISIKQDQINEMLSLVQRTADGKSYAYSTLNLEEKEI